MDIILLGVTVISLGVALVMSIAAWRVTRDEKKRSAARVAALSLAAGSTTHRTTRIVATQSRSRVESSPLESFAARSWHRRRAGDKSAVGSSAVQLADVAAKSASSRRLTCRSINRVLKRRSQQGHRPG